MSSDELLGHLAGDRLLRRLADLDDAAGQVPVALVGQRAQQHPAPLVADQHLRDRALAGEEGVQQRAEALRRLDRRVVAQSCVDGVLRRLHPVAAAGVHPPDALAAHPRPGGDPGAPGVLRLDLRLHPRVAELAERVVDDQLRGPGGVAAAPVAGVHRPGDLAGVLAHVADVDAADHLAAGLDDERDDRAVRGVGAVPGVDGLLVLLVRRAYVRDSRTSARSPRRARRSPPRCPRHATAAASPRRRSGSAGVAESHEHTSQR